MCWCNPSLRTPCCGGITCHPSSSNIANSTKLKVSEPLGEDVLTLVDAKTGDEILKQSPLMLWQNYCDKKQECEEWKDKFGEVLSMLEYAHCTGEWAYEHQKVSDFIVEMYEWWKEKQ